MSNDSGSIAVARISMRCGPGSSVQALEGAVEVVDLAGEVAVHVDRRVARLDLEPTAPSSAYTGRSNRRGIAVRHDP